MTDPDFAWHVRCLPYRSGQPDVYQAILRHAPTGLAGWGMGYSREQARDKAMAFLARRVESCGC
jgi:hypothetical protein